MTRNQIVLVAALVVLLLVMALIIVVVADNVVGMMTPHPTWTGWASPSREGTIEATFSTFAP